MQMGEGGTGAPGAKGVHLDRTGHCHQGRQKQGHRGGKKGGRRKEVDSAYGGPNEQLNEVSAAETRTKCHKRSNRCGEGQGMQGRPPHPPFTFFAGAHTANTLTHSGRGSPAGAKTIGAPHRQRPGARRHCHAP